MTTTLAYPLVRGLILATLLLLIGLISAGFLRDRHGPASNTAAGKMIDGWFQRLPGLLAWFLLVLSMLRGALQVLGFTFPGEPIDFELGKTILTSGSWGTGWVLQTSSAFMLLAVSWLLRGNVRRLRWALVSFTVLLVVAQSGMGHGAGVDWSPAVLGRLVYTTHLMGAGLWLGTLAILAMTTIPSMRGQSGMSSLGSMVVDYSKVARVGVVLLVASGVVASLHYSTSILELPATAWGRLLILKIAAFLAAGVVGLWNWRRVTPQLTAQVAGADRTLSKAILIELLLGVVVIAITAVLVATMLPIDMVE